MKPSDLRVKLNGVIAFPITPFNDDGTINVEGLHRNLQPILREPVSAIVAAAGTGELYSLSPAEHATVVKTVVQEVNGRVPVIAGTGFNPALGAQLAKQAVDAGASGILAFPPYYPSPDDEGLIAYYKQIADAKPLGWLAYSRDWFAPTATQVEALAKPIPNLIAWKDGQADIRRYQRIRHRLGDRLCWIGGAGDDMVPGYYAMGIRTYTSSVANVTPKLSVLIHERPAGRAPAGLAKLNDEPVIPLYASRF